jgi:hypothetical protein
MVPGSISSVYGDGSDGDVVIIVNTQLTRNMQYNNLEVAAGITLDIAGYIIRIRGRLINYRTITDTVSGARLILTKLR